MSAINENVTAGETVCAVLKRDGKTIQTILGKGQGSVPDPASDSDRYEITLVIRDKLTGESRKYEVK